MLQNIIKNISLEYRGDDAGLPPYINRTGNFFYGNSHSAPHNETFCRGKKK